MPSISKDSEKGKKRRGIVKKGKKWDVQRKKIK